MTPEEYLAKSGSAISDAQADMAEILAFARIMLAKSKIGSYVKARTIIRFNTLSALYQRAFAVSELVKAKQGYVANIIVRSMWETLVTYDFINLQSGNQNIDLLLALESKQLVKNWKHIKQLRTDYPHTETWQATISNSEIDRRIRIKQDHVDRYSAKYPSYHLARYDTLLKRLKEIDDTNVQRNAHYDALTQFDYRTVYSILSGDAHSTVLGNLGNSRIHAKSHIEVRLESGNIETLRALQVAYILMLNFLQSFNKTFRLGLATELKKFSKVEKKHNAQYTDITSSTPNNSQ